MNSEDIGSQGGTDPLGSRHGRIAIYVGNRRIDENSEADLIILPRLVFALITHHFLPTSHFPTGGCSIGKGIVLQSG
jgi:hypothetical protein